MREACRLSKWGRAGAEENTSRLQTRSGWRVTGYWAGQWHASPRKKVESERSVQPGKDSVQGKSLKANEKHLEKYEEI